MSIGLCCQYLVPEEKRTGNIVYNNILNEKSLQYNQYLNGNYSESKIQQTWENNIESLYLALQIIHKDKIKSFRMSSSLLPLYDKEEKLLKNNLNIKNGLAKIGKFIKDNNIRLTCHPDQFVVISSEKDSVIKNSIVILNHHAWVMDNMELLENRYYAINIHGGAKGNSGKLINSIKGLSSGVNKRLTLENDERSYNVKDLYKVYEETGVSVVFDSHHHSFNDSGISGEEGYKLAKSTWSDKMLTHLSNTEPGMEKENFTKRRAHSNYAHYIPEWQRLANNAGEIDIDFEFKMKNLAIFDALKKFELVL